MIRLTKQIRENMINDLLTLRFKAEGEALSERSAELFDLVYNDRYKTRTRKIMAQLIAEFRDAFRMRSKIITRANGMAIPVGFVLVGYDNTYFCCDVDPRPFLHCDDGNETFRFSNCPITEKLTQLAADQVKFATAIKTTRTEALGALATITTDRQLADLWPEAMPFLAKYAPVQSGTNLPAVQFSKLTEAFGLSGAA